MKNQVNQEERAYKAWNVLIKIAQTKKRKISYKKLGDAIQIHHRAVRFVLSLIQDYCMENGLPPLTILVINKSTGKPGHGFIAWDFDAIEEGINEVLSENWKEKQNPFEYASTGTSQAELVENMLAEPDNSEVVYGKVKVRGSIQRIFRQALIEAYDCSCAICGMTFPNLLEAAHIIPYSSATPKQRMDIRNGLLLCANHHKMFDSGQITINQDYTIDYYDMEEELEYYTEMDRVVSINLNGRKITCPRKELYYPRLEYLKKHQDSFYTE